MRSGITTIFKEFTSSEKNAGLVLLFCVGISLFISNSSSGESYSHFWHQKIGFDLAGFDMNLSIEHWINDGLMTIFFLLVGLEIERELYAGELHPVKNAILPIFGALGGILFPAAIFLLFNYGTATSNGFGIPMGTDIAFALTVLALAGNKAPLSIKILLTAIAIIDDLCSILIIAFFYGSEIHYLYLAISLGIFALLLVLNRLKVLSIWPYLILGVFMWFFMMQSGIHPTISGVLLAFAFPFGSGNESSPSVKLQHALHLPVAFLILPLFTLANTAISIRPEFVSGMAQPHSVGIALGLFLGKPLGILTALFLIVKLKIVKLPASVNWYDLLALGFIAGIGFTMSIFITQLAFTENALIQSSKLIILVTSAIAGGVGFLLFYLKKSPPTKTDRIMKLVLRLLFNANKLITWIQHKLSPKQFVIFSAILIGLTAGLAAVFLKLWVHFILSNLQSHSPDKQFLIAAFPIIGISLCAFYIHYLNGNRLGKGIANILYAIAKKSSILPRDQTYSHIISSALTVGFGGSAGLESPIVTTGSAIGSNFGRIYKLSYKERTLLLACGAAAGIAGAFNTPIAGVLFALEVLLVEANISAFIPILIASASGALCSKIILQENVLLQFKLLTPFDYANVPFYILLGLACGITSFYYSRVFIATEHYFKRFDNNKIVRVLIGGIFLYVLILFIPPLFGEGYNNIKLLSNLNADWIFRNSIFSITHFSKPVLYLLILLVILLKPIATGITIGSGGNGGNFAPSLFMGAFTGFLFSSIITDLGLPLPISNFTIVAMAGILSGIFHAPLTGIFLIAEITGGYELIIPLMLVSALSYAVSKYFMPLSIDMLKLSSKEKIDTTNTDSYLLSNIDLSEFVEHDFSEVRTTANLKELIEVISKSKRNIFPVVDGELALKGLITIDDIRDIMFRQDLYEKVTVKELMRRPGYLISEKDDIISAMKLFDESHLWNIPVIFQGRYQGFISKSSILEKYREVLIQSSVE